MRAGVPASGEHETDGEPCFGKWLLFKDAKRVARPNRYSGDCVSSGFAIFLCTRDCGLGCVFGAAGAPIGSAEREAVSPAAEKIEGHALTALTRASRAYRYLRAARCF